MLGRLILLLFFIPAITTLDAQTVGIITDKKDNPLPYVNIYYAGSTIGTTSNLDGKFTLPAAETENTIVFQYIGFQSQTFLLTELSSKENLKIIMEPENYSLDQINITANAEDPAYAIIRKAQAKRKFYLAKQQNFICNAYVKGFNEIISAPEKILGQEIGDMEGILNEDGKGVMYLSESISKVYKKGKKIKEIMISSKVSGNDGGYSFNSAKEMDFNFYTNTLEINRDIVSPIARNALTHYNYELVGAHYEGKQLVNKIKILPKNEYGNTFYGHIYINEDLWNIHSLELGVTQYATQLPFIDSLTCTQNFVPVEKDNWMLLSNVMQFKLSALGIKLAGNFGAVFTDYEIGVVTDEDFNNEIFKVIKEANQRSEKYWDTIRPVPLTAAEKIDYHRKDSLRIVRESPAYLDSMDEESNKFDPINILTGYSHKNSRNSTSYNIKSLISSVSINTIQGWNSRLSFDHTKNYNKSKTQRLIQSYNLNYGLSEKTVRGDFEINYRANRTNNARYILKGGKAMNQYSRLDPISSTLNSVFTIFFRKNYLKAYDKEFVSFRHSRQLFNGVTGNVSLEYENRVALQNNFFGGLKQDSRDYTSNNPQSPEDDALAFAPHQALLFRAHIIINVGQKIWNYPDRIFRENSSWPTLGLYFKKGMDIGNNSSDFDLVYASLSKIIKTGIYGNTDLFLVGGSFLGDGPSEFIDRMHFIGTQTHIANESEYSRRFLMLPYYEMSSAENFMQAHVQHNFKGYIMSKIPLLKKTEWQLVGGYKYLTTSDQGTYDEITVGLDNFGFKLFRLLRIDAVFHKKYTKEASSPESKRKIGFIVGSEINF